MSAPTTRSVDPRVHAVRTLAQLLVRHGPTKPSPPETLSTATIEGKPATVALKAT